MVVILEISSWAGISIGAIHYYGKLMFDDPAKKVVDGEGYTTCSGLTSVNMERTLTSIELKVENAQLQSVGLSARYRVGDTTTGFITEQDAINAAIKYFNEHFDVNQSVLYKGSYASYSAWQTLLVWPKKHNLLAKSMNALAKEFQALNGYECRTKPESYIERLDHRWQKRYDKMNDLCTLKPINPT